MFAYQKILKKEVLQYNSTCGITILNYILEFHGNLHIVRLNCWYLPVIKVTLYVKLCVHSSISPKFLKGLQCAVHCTVPKTKRHFGYMKGTFSSYGHLNDHTHAKVHVMLRIIDKPSAGHRCPVVYLLLLI